jgi:hypothetical protein
LDRAELAVVEPDDDPQTSVCPARLRPAPSDHREVLDVEGDHHPSLLRSELDLDAHISGPRIARALR